MLNQLYILLLQYPHANWDWNAVSNNPLITWEIIRAHRDWPWNYSEITTNHSIAPEIIEANPQFPWDYGVISFNMNITWEFAQKHPEIKWDWSVLGRNKKISWEIIQAHRDLFTNNHYISSNNSITWDLVKSHPEFDWDRGVLGKNSTIHSEMFSEYIEFLKSEPRRSMQGLAPESWDGARDSIYSFNMNLTYELIEKYPDYRWEWGFISNHGNITFDIIQAHPDHPWNYYEIGYNPNIDWKTWNQYVRPRIANIYHHGYSGNPNITWQLVRDNPGCFEFQELSKNFFKLHPVFYRRRLKSLLHHWHDRTQKNKEIRAAYRVYMDCVIGELRMRFHDAGTQRLYLKNF